MSPDPGKNSLEGSSSRKQKVVRVDQAAAAAVKAPRQDAS